MAKIANTGTAIVRIIAIAAVIRLDGNLSIFGGNFLLVWDQAEAVSGSGVGAIVVVVT